jgi:molybdenum cofactor biosynthesis enzyme MoaA
MAGLESSGASMRAGDARAPRRDPHRSRVPDLLFEDVRRARVADIGRWLDEPERLAPDAPLHRLTVFLTYRCNLACPYCKTIARTARDLALFPQKRSTFTLASFAALLDSLQDSPIRHLHFTGGEATLVHGLPGMVRLARDRGIEHVSLTSNGARPLDTYVRLIDSGIAEIRISVDARDAATGALLTGRSGAWAQSIATIRALAERRGSDRGVFLIANTVVSEGNRGEVDEIVRYLLALGLDDIKLITVVDSRETLGRFPGAAAVLAEIDHLLSAYPPEALPLLRRKVHTVFSPEAIGLDDDGSTRGSDWRCYIPLTERTVDGRYYYPCSVYLREGGAPLGSLADSPGEQRRKTVQFVRHGRCAGDPICVRYCLHCTRAFNDAANEARAPVAS